MKGRKILALLTGISVLVAGSGCNDKKNSSNENNFVRGEEIEEKPAPDKTRLALDKTVLKFRERKKAEKEEKKSRGRKAASENIIVEVSDKETVQK